MLDRGSASLERAMENLVHDSIPNEPSVRPTGELGDNDLDQVSGGLVVISIIGILVGLLVPNTSSQATQKS
jgi:hypothetical protein